MIGPNKQFSYQTHENGLETQYEDHGTHLEERGSHDRYGKENTSNEQVEKNNSAKQNQYRPCTPKQVDGLGGIILEELHREKVKNDLECPFKTILCLTKFSGMMTNLNFGNPSAIGMGIDWDKTVHFSI